MKTFDIIAIIVTTFIAVSYIWLVCSIFWQFLQILASE